MTKPQKYTKRPVTIEAMRTDRDISTVTAILDWINGGPGAMGRATYDVDLRIHIDTLEGVMIASPGDYIIRGVQGEFYPCRSDIFHLTYDAPMDRP